MKPCRSAGLTNAVQPTEAELFQFFPPADQDRAFKSDLANKIQVTCGQIAPTAGQPFTGDRLLERVALKHFDGDYSRMHGKALIPWGVCVDKITVVLLSPSIATVAMAPSPVLPAQPGQLLTPLEQKAMIQPRTVGHPDKPPES